MADGYWLPSLWARRNSFGLRSLRPFPMYYKTLLPWQVPGRTSSETIIPLYLNWPAVKASIPLDLRNYIPTRTLLALTRKATGFGSQIDRITDFFANEEVDEIWITFPDPQLRISKSKKRLTHPKFLRLYYQILVPGGKIHLKTDSPDLYRFTKKVIDMYGCSLHQDMDDVYAEPGIPAELRIKTHYESLDIAGSNRVHYVCFSLPKNLPSKEMDLALQQYLKDEAGID
jgi:hypothetical protein